MTLDSKLASDVLVTTVVNLAQKLRGIVFLPLITQLLGTAAYGAYVQVGVVARLCSKCSLLGFDSALIRFAQDKNEIERSRLYSTLLVSVVVTSSIGAIAIFSLAGTISSLFLGSDGYTRLFQLGSILIPTYAIQDLGQNYYRSEMNVKRYSVLEGIKTYLNVGAVAVALLVADAKLSGLLAIVVVTELAFAGGIQFVVLRSTGLHGPVFDEFGEYVRYAVPLMLGNLSGMVQDRSDRLLLGYVLGANAVGIYSISYTVAKLLRTYTIPLELTFFPEFSRLWAEGKQERCFRYLSNGTRYLLGLAIPSVAGLYLVADPLIGTLSTPAAATQAPVLLPVLAAGITLIGLDTLYRQLFYADGKTATLSILRLGGAGLNIVLNVLLIPVAGVVGAAIATLVTFSSLLAVLYWMTVRTYGVTLEYSYVAKTIGSATGMLLVALASGIQSLVALLVLCPLLYAALMTVSGAIRVDEVRSLLGAIHSSVST